MQSVQAAFQGENDSYPGKRLYMGQWFSDFHVNKTHLGIGNQLQRGFPGRLMQEVCSEIQHELPSQCFWTTLRKRTLGSWYCVLRTSRIWNFWNLLEVHNLKPLCCAALTFMYR